MTIVVGQKIKMENDDYFPWEKIMLENGEMFKLEKKTEENIIECKIISNKKDGIFIHLSYRDYVPTVFKTVNGKMIVDVPSYFIHKHQAIAIDSLGVFATERHQSENKLVYPLEASMTKLNYFSEELKLLPNYIQNFLNLFHCEVDRDKF